ISPDTHDTEDRFYPRENESLKKSLESSSEPLEGTSEHPVGDATQELAVLPVQKRRLGPSAKMCRHLRKAARTRRMRKSQRKEKVKTHRPGVLPAPFVPPRSEDDEAAGKKLTLLSAKERWITESEG
ncbi:hypothetical protein Celaphus_00019564, partial [Cervus elaphus hippelaphus]